MPNTNADTNNQLEAEIKELRDGNHKKRNMLHSLKLVLSESKNANARLKVEERERKLRLDQMKTAKETWKQSRQLNSKLLKFILEQQAASNANQHRDEIVAEIQKHERIQNNMKEKLLSLKAEHENMPDVKKCNELRHEENIVIANIEEVKMSMESEEKLAHRTLNDLNKNINGKILAVVVKAKLVADIESGKFCNDLSVLTTFDSDIGNITEIEKPPLIIQKLADITFPEMLPCQRTDNRQTKRDVPFTLEKLKKDVKANSKDFSVQSNVHYTKVESKPEKTEDKTTYTTSRCYGLKRTKSAKENSVEPVSKTMTEVSPLKRKMQDVNNTSQMVRTRAEKFENPGKVESPAVKSDNIRAISNQDTASHSNLKTHSKKCSKIVVLSDVTIKKAVANTEDTEDRAEGDVHKVSENRNRQTECFENRNSETLVLGPQVAVEDPGHTAPLHRTVMKNSSFDLEKKVLNEKLIALKRTMKPDDRNMTLKLSPLKKLKGIKLQPFDNTPVDLNTDLPSSHITINSSNQSNENVGKRSKQLSPVASSNSSGFMNDFQFDVVSPKENGRKRKLSSGSQLDDGFDYASFNFNKKSKEGSDEELGDFSKMMDTSLKGGKDANKDDEFDFESFMGLFK